MPELKKLSQREIVIRKTELCDMLDVAIDELERSKARYNQVKRQIVDMQSQCPHENTTERLVNDGPEMKNRRFCIDCGAQL